MDLLSLSSHLSAECGLLDTHLHITAQEVARYAAAGEEKKVCCMLRLCEDVDSPVWQPASSPYCAALHPHVPHPAPARPCAMCRQNGMYVPLLNLLCFHQLPEALHTLLTLDAAGQGTATAGGGAKGGARGRARDGARGGSRGGAQGGAYYSRSAHLRACDGVGFHAVHVCVVTGYVAGLRAVLSHTWIRDPGAACGGSVNAVTLAIQIRQLDALATLCELLTPAATERVSDVCVPPRGGCVQRANPLQLIVRDTQPWTEGLAVVLRRGVAVDVEDDCGRTPLFYAVEYGQQHVITALTQHGANVNHVDTYGRTPLACVFASHAPSLPTLLQLLALGADPLIPDTANLLPIDKAIKLQRTKCVETLIRFCHPLDLFSLACDHIKVVAHFKKIHRIHSKLVSLRSESLHSMLHSQLAQEARVWLWLSVWLIVCSGRLLVPLLDRHLPPPVTGDPALQQCHDYVRALMAEYHAHPLSLQETCRFRIRMWLRDVREASVHALPLPKPLLRYLLCEDVIAQCSSFIAHTDDASDLVTRESS